jgi:hypothetical protein
MPNLCPARLNSDDRPIRPPRRLPQHVFYRRELCGVESALELHLNATEQKVLEASVAILQRAYATLQPT